MFFVKKFNFENIFQKYLNEGVNKLTKRMLPEVPLWECLHKM